MRGITNMIYRQAFVRHFGGMDLEMAPFISTVHSEKINPKLLKDVLPENSSGLPLIPQLIGTNAEDFVQMCHALQALGYTEVNWNMGCPHKPIRKKKRGSGMLAHPGMVDTLLDHVCANSPLKLSVKVRLGISGPDDLRTLIPILNRYPLTEVIIHPRTAEQMYTGTVDLDAFAEASAALTHTVCYNGDIDSFAFYQQVSTRFPSIERFMLGRGLLANPFLGELIKNGNAPLKNPVQRIHAFHNDICTQYEQRIGDDHGVLGKMKEFWTYQSLHLSNGHKLFKQLKKAQSVARFKAIIDDFLADASWNPS
jgi:tRNA-dihydrouridine synthase B